MPGVSRVLDPVLRDYVSDGKGGNTKTATIATSAVIRLRARLNRFWASPTLGSELYTFRQQVASKKQIQSAVKTVQAALQPLVDAKRADQLSVTSTQNQYGRVVLAISMRDLQQGAQVDLTLEPFRT